MKFRDYIKKYLVIFIIIIVIPAIIIMLFALLGGKIEPKDWLSFSGSALAYFGTTILSVVALYQNKRANDLTEQANDLTKQANNLSQQANDLAHQANELAKNANLLSEKAYELSERSYMTIFAISKVEGIQVFGCMHVGEIEKIHFCAVDMTPDECQGYLLTLRNCSQYPIISVNISTTYPIGRSEQTETLERTKDCCIVQDEATDFLLCNTPQFIKNHCEVIFEIRCKNIFGREMTQKLTIMDSFRSGNLRYTCIVV